MSEFAATVSSNLGLAPSDHMDAIPNAGISDLTHSQAAASLPIIHTLTPQICSGLTLGFQPPAHVESPNLARQDHSH